MFGLAGLDRLVQVLIADGYRVIGPTVRDSAIVLDELDSAARLPAGWGWTPARAAARHCWPIPSRISVPCAMQWLYAMTSDGPSYASASMV